MYFHFLVIWWLRTGKQQERALEHLLLKLKMWTAVHLVHVHFFFFVYKRFNSSCWSSQIGNTSSLSPPQQSSRCRAQPGIHRWYSACARGSTCASTGNPVHVVGESTIRSAPSSNAQRFAFCSAAVHLMQAHQFTHHVNMNPHVLVIWTPVAGLAAS
jgi:hypothetical protein